MQPFVSVLLPVRNEARFMAGCLEALANQDYPRDRFEVILIDGQSTDDTLVEVRRLEDRVGVPDRIETNPRRTTATGLNLGLQLVRGEIIVRVDGHTRVDPGFISANVSALQRTGADAAGGPIRTLSNGTVGEAIALAMASPFGVGDAAFRHSDREQWTDSVPFAAYRREVFDRIGGFAEDIDRGEDDEFNYRLREAGGRILLTPAIGSEYYARDSIAGLLRQYWGYGIAKANVLSRHPRSLRPRHLVPSTLVLALTLGPLLALLDRRFACLTALAASSYALANAVASLRIAHRGHSEAAPYLPVAFACMHFGAGSGMLFGFLARLRSLIPSPAGEG